jgi:ribonuclease Z
MEITFLGTSSMVPTKKRNHSGIFLEYAGEGILFDCGEGTQRQLRLADIAATKITRVCLSHWHGDHVLGLPGLIQTMGGMGYTQTLHIYGVPGSAKYLEYMFKGFANYTTVKFEVHEVKEGILWEDDTIRVECIPLRHSIYCIGFSVIEKDKLRINMDYLTEQGVPAGKHLKYLQNGQDLPWKGKTIAAKDATYVAHGRKFTYVADTKLCDNAVKLAKDADILVTECTHSHDIEEKAEQYMHLTAPQGAQIAKDANAKKLILTHFSQRYDNVDELVKQAKEIFPNTSAAYDFLTVKMEKKH